MGKLIHESRYPRAKKDIIVDNVVSIGFLKKGGVLGVFAEQSSIIISGSGVLQKRSFCEIFLKVKPSDICGIKDSTYLTESPILRDMSGSRASRRLQSSAL